MVSREAKLKLVRRPASAPTFVLSPAQSHIVAHRDSPLVVLGGPGTGKTTTIVEAVCDRVRSGVDPNSILIITYGREWASSLRDQIALAAGTTSFEPLSRTFHSLAFSILNEKLAADSARYVLISGAEQDLVISQMLGSPHASSQSIPWHPELSAAIQTRGFVREIRDLISRATELGLDAKSLQQRGELLQEKYWNGAAHFWSSYFGANELKSATVGERLVRIDPSAIINEAIYLLQEDPARLDSFRKRFTTIIVDEFQESDSAQRKLLELLAPRDLMIFADPDSAIGRFRGADSDSLLRYLTSLGATQIVLDQNFRNSCKINSLLSDISGRFRQSSPTRTSVTSGDSIEAGEISVAKLASQGESAQLIAHALRLAHLQDGISWSEMAVIVRTPGTQVSALQRAFAQNHIPVSIGASATALAENPAILPILNIASLALKNTLTIADWPVIEEVLLSEFGGADALQLRQIRLAFTAVRTDHRSTTEMMIDALTSKVAELPWEQIKPLKQLNDLLAVARKTLRTSTEVADLLWSIWNNAVNYEGSRIPELWRERALAGGARGANADRDLDAVIQLFESARRFAERNVGAAPQLFITQLLNERILGDSITESAQREEVVTVTTVHSAKGREWEFVVVTGLQEGTWPNLKERGSLLGSERLVEAARSGLQSRAEIAAAAASGLAEDERRLLYVALSRAKRRLLITGYSEEDSEPSRYFEEIHEAVHGTTSDEAVVKAPRQITSQALVATLRRNLIENSASDQFTAKLLHTLWKSGISAADPATWLGYLEPSSNDPVVPPNEPIRVSPSSLTTFDECGLKWFLQKSGANDGDSSAQLLGVAIHFIAEKLLTTPDLAYDEACEQLTAAWPIVDQNVGWVKEQKLGEAKEMLKRFFDWHEANPRTLVLVESDFEVTFDRVILKGSADRIELDPTSGKYFIVDLKTGTAITKDEAKENKQLSAYQLGLLKSGFEELPADAQSAGAGLLFLKKDAKEPKTYDQPPIDPEIIQSEIKVAAEGMAGSSFTAVLNKSCRVCAVRALCPLQTEGRSVIS